MLALLRILFPPRCRAVATLCSTTGGFAVRCDRRPHVHDQHVADRGMDEIRWTEHLEQDA